MSKSSIISEIQRALIGGFVDTYVKGLELDVLISLRNELVHDVLTNNKDAILRALDDEFEYRCLNNYIPEKDSTFLSRKFDLKMNDDTHNEVRKSIELLDSLGVSATVIRWVPAFLYIDKAFAVYSYLKSMNRTQTEINKVFLSSFDTFMTISERTRIKEEYNQYYEEFINYIVYLAQLVASRKSVTESYQKYTLDILNQNQELLRRLS